MNSNYHLDIAYIAGLFDGEGCVTYKKYKEKKKVPKGMKKQWRWRCTFRECLDVCKKLWPYAIVKLHDIEKVIDHYEPEIQDLDDNVVELDKFRNNVWFGKEK